MQSPFVCPVVQRLIGILENYFKEQVRLLEHIPEIEIILRKFKAAKFLVLDNLRTKRTQTCKHPATARTFLVANALYIGLVLELMVSLANNITIHSQTAYIIVRQRIADTLVGFRLLLVIVTDAVDNVFGQVLGVLGKQGRAQS